MNATEMYYHLKDKSEATWKEAYQIIDTAEVRCNRKRCADRGEISQELEAEWQRALADFYALQEQAIKLEQQAIDMRVEMLHEQYVMADDRTQELREQEELRRG